MAQYDLIIVGAGIVAAASAWQIKKDWPDCRMLILEKEAAPARHQTGHNSGVIHAGVYYAPGSLKAKMCRQGLSDTLAFCAERGIATQQCGKLIVATDSAELDGLKQLRERALANGLAPVFLTADALREQEPALQGEAALLISDSAIVDYRQVCQALLDDVVGAGAELRLAEEVVALSEAAEVTVTTAQAEYRSRYLLNCAGLMADRLIRMMGLPCDFRIMPFRGEFYRLVPEKAVAIRKLVYPVPDASLPFLGVHLTPQIGGGVLAGPNAVLALQREGYSWADINIRDLAEMAAFPGAWKLLARYWRAGASELFNSLNKQRYLKLLQRYCPGLEESDLLPARSGVRAQAVSAEGELLQDFRFVRGKRSLHIGNAPSPAATSALPIGRHVAKEFQQLREHFS